MTDIVERLRSPANVFYEYAADNGAFLREAADEIERLREALRLIGESCPSHIIRSKDADVNAFLAYNAGFKARAALKQAQPVAAREEK